MDRYGNLDGVDLAILDLLQKDASLSFKALSKRLADDYEIGLSEGRVLRRIGNLKEHGFIIKYQAILNPKKLDLGDSYIMLINLNRNNCKTLDENFNKFKLEIDACFKNVIECRKITGEWDYIIKIIVKDAQHYNSILNRMMKLECVSNIKSLSILDDVNAPTPAIKA